jgi:hypothetical protein
MKSLLVLSDTFSVMLFKSYVEPLNCTVKHIDKPSSLLKFF